MMESSTRTRPMGWAHTTTTMGAYSPVNGYIHTHGYYCMYVCMYVSLVYLSFFGIIYRRMIKGMEKERMYLRMVVSTLVSKLPLVNVCMYVCM